MGLGTHIAAQRPQRTLHCLPKVSVLRQENEALEASNHLLRAKISALEKQVRASELDYESHRAASAQHAHKLAALDAEVTALQGMVQRS